MFDAKKIFLFLLFTKNSFANEGEVWANEVMPDNSWYEKLQPEFVYCANKAKTDLSVYSQAINYWKKLGYLKGASSKITVEYCENNHDDLGKIRLAGDEEIDEGYYGVTTRQLIKVKKSNGDVNHYIGSAYIRIEVKYANDLNMVIHELGHAIGLNHKHEKDSIMYTHHMDEETKL